MSAPPVALVCVACRDAGRGLYRLDGALVCAGCGTAYPRVDGVACLPPNLPAFLEAQSPSPAASADSPSLQEALLPGVYARAHYPDPNDAVLGCNAQTLTRLAECVLRGAPATVLDAGCGPGGLTQRLAAGAPVVGFDVRLSMLRVAARLSLGESVSLPVREEADRLASIDVRGASAPQTTWVQGDILAPPFEAEAFRAIVASSLLDTVSEPFVALGQLDALLAPGGRLVLAHPWHWEPAVTPPAAWLTAGGESSPGALRRLLTGGHAAMPWLCYDLESEEEGLPWVLPSHSRLTHTYRLHVLVARKRASSL